MDICKPLIFIRLRFGFHDSHAALPVSLMVFQAPCFNTAPKRRPSVHAVSDFPDIEPPPL
ncbi:MAG: hypothetical protein IGR76_07170 [Synechococcales cyanobacterium T60_A2020_003]|nr:hypothetical protein [Synechococcales cyanobacterium T60_A2020_003]